MSEMFTSLALLSLSVAVFSMLMSARADRRRISDLAKVVQSLVAERTRR